MSKLSAILENCQNKKKIAIYYKDQALTYEQLCCYVNNLSAHLKSMRLEHKQIACFLPNCPEFIILFLACFKIGITIVPINHRNMPEEIDRILHHVEASYFVFHENDAEKIREVHYLSGNCNKIIVAKQFYDFSLNCLSFDTLTHEALKKDTSDVSEDTFASITCTSGSTGKPKGVVHSHYSLMNSALNWIDVLSLNPNSVVLIPEGFLLIVASLKANAAIVLMEQFTVSDFLLLVLKHQVTTLCMLIHYYIDLTCVCDLKNDDLKSLKVCVTGGDHIPSGLQKKFYTLSHVWLYTCYGLTEAPILTINKSNKEKSQGSIGKPIHNVQILLKKEENQSRPGGYLLCKSPSMFIKYWKDRKLTNSVFIDGWFDTGDFASVDENLYYWLAGRRKYCIICGGYNIFPQEIEAVISSHSAIKQACVVAVKHQKLGHVANAYVALKKGQNITEKDLLRFLSQKIATYKIPFKIFFVEKIPVNISGKVARHKF